MSDSVSFGGGIGIPAQAATIETIFAHIQKDATDDVELMRLVERADEFDAMGGWFFDNLSVQALERLQNVLQHLEADLPGPISHWPMAHRPLFYKDISNFSEKLAERIAQLRAQLQEKK